MESLGVVGAKPGGQNGARDMFSCGLWYVVRLLYLSTSALTVPYSIRHGRPDAHPYTGRP